MVLAPNITTILMRMIWPFFRRNDFIKQGNVVEVHQKVYFWRSSYGDLVEALDQLDYAADRELNPAKGALFLLGSN